MYNSYLFRLWRRGRAFRSEDREYPRPSRFRLYITYTRISGKMRTFSWFRFTYRYANNRFQLFGCCFSRIRQIYFMVQACIDQIERIALRFDKRAHCGYCRRLAIITSDVHTLDTESLVKRKHLGGRKVDFLFCRTFLNSPFKILLFDEIGQAYHRDPAKVVLAGIIERLSVVHTP